MPPRTRPNPAPSPAPLRMVANKSTVVHEIETLDGTKYLGLTVDKNPVATNLIYTVEKLTELACHNHLFKPPVFEVAQPDPVIDAAHVSPEHVDASITVELQEQDPFAVVLVIK